MLWNKRQNTNMQLKTLSRYVITQHKNFWTELIWKCLRTAKNHCRNLSLWKIKINKEIKGILKGRVFL